MRGWLLRPLPREGNGDNDMSYYKEIELAPLTGGKLMGNITIFADGWHTRYSWGHTAEISVGFNTVAKYRIRYYNRTWESYRFQSAIHGALEAYVKWVTGIDPYKAICKRDEKPMKSAAAEVRRLERVAAHNFARDLYNALCAKADGKAVAPITAVA